MDDLLSTDNTYFYGIFKQSYPSELQLNKANLSDTEAPFLDLHLTISDGFVASKRDKRDDFDFDIVNFPFLVGDIPRATSFGVYISQLIRFARMSSHVAGFNTISQILTAKLLQQGYRYHKLRFQNSINVTMAWFQNLIWDSNLFLNKAYRKLNFLATKMYKGLRALRAKNGPL